VAIDAIHPPMVSSTVNSRSALTRRSAMRIRVVRVIREDCADGKTCPALADTDRGTCVVVGEVLRDAEALADAGLAIGDNEIAVEVPASLLGR
jgi:hypothetical protein